MSETAKKKPMKRIKLDQIKEDAFCNMGSNSIKSECNPVKKKSYLDRLKKWFTGNRVKICGCPKD